MTPDETPQVHSASESIDWTALEEGTEVVFRPQVIFDGEQEHTHYYVERFVDLDGRVNVMCAHCPFGTLFNPDEFTLVDGKLVAKR